MGQNCCSGQQRHPEPNTELVNHRFINLQQQQLPISNIKDRGNSKIQGSSWYRIYRHPRLDSTVLQALRRISSTDQPGSEEAMFECQMSHDVYCGQMSELRIPNGRGRFYLQNGEYYEGTVQMGLGTGQGIYIYQGGRIYQGQFLNFRPHGQGTYKDPLFQFNGEWENGKIGSGVYRFPNGTQIKVQSNQDAQIRYDSDRIYRGSVNQVMKPHGRGKLEDNGKVYQGEWKDGLMHGRGTHTWENGSVYEGQYQGGKKHGFGTFTFPAEYQGLVYEGYFENGKPKGQGRYKKMGIVLEGFRNLIESSVHDEAGRNQLSRDNPVTRVNLPQSGVESVD